MQVSIVSGAIALPATLYHKEFPVGTSELVRAADTPLEWFSALIELISD